MLKIDRLGWAAGLSVVCYGVRVGLRAEDQRTLDAFVERLPPGWKPSTSAVVPRLYSFIGGGTTPSRAKRYHLAYADAARLVRSLSAAEALDAFERDVRLHVAGRARQRVFVHAGVVEWGGRAIIVPGRSHSGKSTLVAALLRAGAIYYSDEYAVLDGRGRVHPFPAPLSLRAADRSSGARLSQEALGTRCGRGPIAIGAVVVTSFWEGAGWRPRALSQGEAVLALLEHTVAARQRPEEALRALSLAARAAWCLKGPRGEADDTARRLLAMVEGGRPPKGAG